MFLLFFSILLAGGFGLTAAPKPLPAANRAAADRLIDAALRDDEGLKRLEYLCYRIGSRLSGSASLERAVTWSAEEMTRAGLENVRILPVKVPRWVRGRESAEILEPVQKPLVMLGLGRRPVV